MATDDSTACEDGPTRGHIYAVVEKARATTAELCLQLVLWRILARLHNRQFFSLAQLRARLNSCAFRKLPASFELIPRRLCVHFNNRFACP